MSEKSHTILVADDDTGNLEYILEILKGMPYTILYAPNGIKAVDIAREEVPDLILMDWEMPHKNGIEAIEDLKKQEKTARIPVIVNTGVMLDDCHLSQALESGAVDFLRKPFRQVELIARIQSNLRIREQQLAIEKLLRTEQELLLQSLEHKQRELCSSALIEHEKNQMLELILTELDALVNRYDITFSQRLRQLKKRVKQQMSLGSSWTKFKLHFDQVHPSFFHTLSEKFGPLSSNEQKMCAYLKIGLTNKEIALLSNIEEDSVKKNLHRLKKKLVPGSDITLRNLIQVL